MKWVKATPSSCFMGRLALSRPGWLLSFYPRFCLLNIGIMGGWGHTQQPSSSFWPLSECSPQLGMANLPCQFNCSWNYLKHIWGFLYQIEGSRKTLPKCGWLVPGWKSKEEGDFAFCLLPLSISLHSFTSIRTNFLGIPIQTLQEPSGPSLPNCHCWYSQPGHLQDSWPV